MNAVKKTMGKRQYFPIFTTKNGRFFFRPFLPFYTISMSSGLSTVVFMPSAVCSWVIVIAP